MLLSRACVSEGGAATRGGVTAGDPDDADAAAQLGLGVHVGLDRVILPTIAPSHTLLCIFLTSSVISYHIVSGRCLYWSSASVSFQSRSVHVAGLRGYGAVVAQFQLLQ